MSEPRSVNGVGRLFNRQQVLEQLSISSSTLDRLVSRGELTVAKKIDIGRGKLSPRFDRDAVQELAARRREGLASDTSVIPSDPDVPSPPPAPAPSSPGALMAAVKALHASQLAILDALEQRRGVAIEAELWHSVLSLTRTQENILTEVLIGTPMPQETVAHAPQATPI